MPAEFWLRAASLGFADHDEVVDVGEVTAHVLVRVVPVVVDIHTAHPVVLLVSDVIGAPVVSEYVEILFRCLND